MLRRLQICEHRGRYRSPDDGHMNALMTSGEDPAAKQSKAYIRAELTKRVKGVKEFESKQHTFIYWSSNVDTYDALWIYGKPRLTKHTTYLWTTRVVQSRPSEEVPAPAWTGFDMSHKNH